MFTISIVLIRTGKKRALQIDEALDVIDYKVESCYNTQYELKRNDTTRLVDCQYFTTNLLDLDQTFTKNLGSIDSFKIYLGLEGSAELKYTEYKISITAGESVLIPASFGEMTFMPQGSCKILESYIG